MERRSSAKRKTRKEVHPRRLNGKRIPDIPEDTMKNCVRNFSERMNRKGLTPPLEEGTPESVFHRRHFWQNFSAANNGLVDCNIKRCPLYPFMPYRDDKMDKGLNSPDLAPGGAVRSPRGRERVNTNR